MRKPDSGNGMETEKLGGFDSSVTSDNLAIVINEDRIAETKLFDALRDLLDLLLAVRPCVVCIGPQLAHQSVFYLHVSSPFCSTTPKFTSSIRVSL